MSTTFHHNVQAQTSRTLASNMSTYMFGGGGIWSDEGKVLDDFLGVLSLSGTRLSPEVGIMQ